MKIRLTNVCAEIPEKQLKPIHGIHVCHLILLIVCSADEFIAQGVYSRSFPLQNVILHDMNKRHHRPKTTDN